MSKFKVGDRVALYDEGKRFKGVIILQGDRTYGVDLGYLGAREAHEKQLRRLTKPTYYWAYDSQLYTEEQLQSRSSGTFIKVKKMGLTKLLGDK